MISLWRSLMADGVHYSQTLFFLGGNRSTIKLVIEIPLFPLNTVLFPGMPLQLHIFEERYKKLVMDCTEKDTPFGVVLIKRGAEAFEPVVEPFSVGCTAQISSIEPLSQGRFNIWTVGRERFEILKLQYDRPYLVGVVREYPLQMNNPTLVKQQMNLLRPWMERYLRALGQGEEMEKVIQQIPTEPDVFAYLGAVILQIPAIQKQPFIEAPECLLLLQKLEVAFRREVAFLENPKVASPTPMQGQFSIN